MKKIIVFGATGGTGKEVVKQALEKGYEVTAVIRNPSGFDLQHQHLKISKGDVLQPSTFEKEIMGKEAVISCLGTGTGTKPTTIYSEGIQNIIAAMNKAEVKRLVCISAGALYTNKEMGFFIRILTKFVLQKILKEPYSDVRAKQLRCYHVVFLTPTGLVAVSPHVNSIVRCFLLNLNREVLEFMIFEF